MPWPAPEGGVLLRRVVQRGDPTVSAVAPFRTPHSKMLIKKMLKLFKTTYRFTLSQCCGPVPVLICCGSGSDFGKVLVTPVPAPVPAPVPDPDNI